MENIEQVDPIDTKRRGFLVYDETQAINALIYFAGVKESNGFGCTKDGYRVKIERVNG